MNPTSPDANPPSSLLDSVKPIIAPTPGLVVERLISFIDKADSEELRGVLTKCKTEGGKFAAQFRDSEMYLQGA